MAATKLVDVAFTCSLEALIKKQSGVAAPSASQPAAAPPHPAPLPPPGKAQVLQEAVTFCLPKAKALPQFVGHEKLLESFLSAIVLTAANCPLETDQTLFNPSKRRATGDIDNGGSAEDVVSGPVAPAAALAAGVGIIGTATPAAKVAVTGGGADNER